MTIPELPLPLRNLAREYQKNETFNNKKTNDLGSAFGWIETKEGFTFWSNLYLSKSMEESIHKMSTNNRVKLYRILNTPKQTSYLYPLFKHLSDEHNITLLDSEMEEIVRIVLRLNETNTKTSCHGSNDEYPTEQGTYFCIDERGQMLVMEWVGEKENWNKIDWWLKKEL